MHIVFFMALVGLAAFCQNLTGFAFGLIFVGVAGYPLHKEVPSVLVAASACTAIP
jgi:hypothetical protein